MLKKPEFRGEKYARCFQDAGVVQVYHHRPPYPDEVYDKLAYLVDPDVDALLDVGTGLGEIARRMAARVGRVDAVDFSERMIARAKSLPGGDHPGITWTVSHVETAPVTSPYGLITAAGCLHWFDLNVAMPRFARLLSPAGYLAVVERDWQTGIEDRDIVAEYSTQPAILSVGPCQRDSRSRPRRARRRGRRGMHALVPDRRGISGLSAFPERAVARRDGSGARQRV